MDINKGVLLIFVKNPKRGEVKTRLAETIGDQQALQIYQRLLILTKKVTDKLNQTKQVWYSNFVPETDLWDTGNYEKRMQSGADLGERMKNAFKDVFDDGYRQVVIIGSDCAELETGILHSAFEELDDVDLVIGPSEDGGYYLLGMSLFYPDVFDNIDWSTSSVFQQTVDKATKIGLSTTLLPTLNDIDTEQDLKEFNQRHSDS